MTTSIGPDGKPTAFFDLPEEAFPVILQGRLERPDGELLWEIVAEPYVACPVPGANPEHAGRIGVLIKLATGEVSWEPPRT